MQFISGKSQSSGSEYDPMEGPSNGPKDSTFTSDVFHESFTDGMKDLQEHCSTPASEYYDLTFFLVYFFSDP